MSTPALRASLVGVILQILLGVACAQNDSARERYEATIQEFDRQVVQAKENRQALHAAKQRLDNSLEEQYRDLRESIDATATEQDLLVALDIAGRLGRSSDVLLWCDQLLTRKPRPDAPVFSKLRALLSLGELEEARVHVSHELRAVAEDSDYYSMCGLLLAALHEQGQWREGVDYGSRFLQWCGCKIRTTGRVDVAVSVFLGLFVTCAEKADRREALARAVAALLVDVRAGIALHKTNHDDPLAASIGALRLFPLWHQLDCLSADPNPAECDIEWFRSLSKAKRLGADTRLLAHFVAESVSACMGAICCVRDLDSLLLATRECRSVFEIGTGPSDVAGGPASESRALLRLEKLIAGELAARDKVGSVSDIVTDVDWHAESDSLEAGAARVLVYVWMPTGTNPGEVLTGRLREMRNVIDIPIVILSPYTAIAFERSANQGDRQKAEGAAIVRLARRVDRGIGVACVAREKLLPRLPTADLPQMYVIAASGKIETVVIGYDKLRLQLISQAVKKSDSP